MMSKDVLIHFDSDIENIYLFFVLDILENLDIYHGHGSKESIPAITFRHFLYHMIN